MSSSSGRDTGSVGGNEATVEGEKEEMEDWGEAGGVEDGERGGAGP